MRFRDLTTRLLLLLALVMYQCHALGIIPGSTKPCKIKKLVVRITRIVFSVYGDTSEPPVTEVIVNYYDPQSKTAKQLGKTPPNTNGRTLQPVWNEEDGIIESDENPGLMSVVDAVALSGHGSKQEPFPSTGPTWRSSSSS